MSAQTNKKDSHKISVLTYPTRNPAEVDGVLYLLVILTAVLLTRFSWAPVFLSTDSVNLAYALELFDPRLHQPHPPGYPLFVAFARLVHSFSPNVEVTFWIISVVVTTASAAVLSLLASRMFSRWVLLPL
jgi:hypothetical protein